MSGILNALEQYVRSRQPPTDFSDRYNTQLTPAEEVQFVQWKKKLPKHLQNESDYDLRGAWKGNAQASGNGHLQDTWKKPNHPTFSGESIYSGVGGNQGGQWSQMTRPPVETWRFNAGPTNEQYHSEGALQEYFNRHEAGNKLAYPMIYKR